MKIEDLIWEFENGSISPYKLVEELKEIQLKEKRQYPKVWKGTSKKLIDGYWYVKIADIKLGNV